MEQDFARPMNIRASPDSCRVTLWLIARTAPVFPLRLCVDLSGISQPTARTPWDSRGISWWVFLPVSPGCHGSLATAFRPRDYEYQLSVRAFPGVADILIWPLGAIRAGECWSDCVRALNATLFTHPRAV